MIKLKTKKKKKAVEAEAEFTTKLKKKSKIKRVVAPAPKNHNKPPEEIDDEDEPEVETIKNEGRDSGGIAGKQLLQFINQVERLEEEKKALADDIKDIYAHAKSTGFDIKIVRKVIAMRKKNKADVEEEMALIDTYRHAIGDI